MNAPPQRCAAFNQFIKTCMNDQVSGLDHFCKLLLFSGFLNVHLRWTKDKSHLASIKWSECVDHSKDKISN